MRHDNRAVRVSDNEPCNAAKERLGISATAMAAHDDQAGIQFPGCFKCGFAKMQHSVLPRPSHDNYPSPFESVDMAFGFGSFVMGLSTGRTVAFSGSKSRESNAENALAQAVPGLSYGLRLIDSLLEGFSSRLRWFRILSAKEGGGGGDS
jgi:hypothetical protein